MARKIAYYTGPPPTVDPKVPTVAIKYHMGWVHVGTPASEVEQDMRDTIQKKIAEGGPEADSWTPEIQDQVVQYALWCHAENMGEYQSVMGSRKVADNNPFGGGSSQNPFATNTPQSQPQPQAPPTGSPVDPQSTNSMDAETGIGGDDLPIQAPDSTTHSNQGQPTASLYMVACMACGQEGVLEKVSASTLCKCGSDSVVYDKVDLTAPIAGADPSSDGSAKMTFSSGITGFVYPLDKGNWHWSIVQANNALRHGIAYSRDQAQRICERLAPEYAKPITEASKTAGAKVVKSPGGKSWAVRCDTNECRSTSSMEGLTHDGATQQAATHNKIHHSASKTACHVVKNGDDYDVMAGGKSRGKHKSREDAEAQREAIESSEHSAAKTSSWQKFAAFPPPKKKDDDSGDDKDKKDPPPGDDKGGDAPPAAPAGPPVGQPVPPAAPGVPAVPGQAPPAAAPPTTGGELPAAPAADPNAPPVDPNAAPVDPNAAQVDPNAPVPPGGPVGTEPMDIAQGTLEGMVDQVNGLGHDAKEIAYDVDKLFSEWRCMNCDAEGRADIGEDGQVAFSGDLLDQPQGCAAPQVGLPDQSGLDAAAPVPSGDGVEVGQQDIPAATAKKHKFLRNPFKRANSETQNDLNNDRPNLNEDNQSESQDYDEAIKNEKIATLTEKILVSNPGMNQSLAHKIASDTVTKFPSIVR